MSLAALMFLAFLVNRFVRSRPVTLYISYPNRRL